MLILVLIILFAAIIISDFLPKIKTWPKRDSFVYCVILSAGFIILIIFSINVSIAGLTKHIIDFITIFTGKLK